MHLLSVRVMDGRDDPLLNNKLFCVIQAVTGHFCKGQGNATVLKNCRSMIVYVCMCVCVWGGGGGGGAVDVRATISYMCFGQMYLSQNYLRRRY